MSFKQPDSLNSAPYFDDFSDQKNFLQMLFKPGVAVQARELTQLQTLLQNQISKISDHVFKDGSQVFGAKVTISPYYFMRVAAGSIKNSAGTVLTVDTTSYTSIVSYFKAKSFIPVLYTKSSVTQSDRTVIRNLEEDFQIEIIDVIVASSTDDLILIFKFTKGNLENLKTLSALKLTEVTNGNYVTLSASPVNTPSDNQSPINFTVQPQGTSGSSVVLENINTVLIVNVSSGIFYKDGRFVNTPDSSTILYKTSGIVNGLLDIESTMVDDNRISSSGLTAYENRKLFSAPTKKIGFEITTEIIDFTLDSSLLDNATGSYNDKAPGADRLRITFTLTNQDIDPELIYASYDSSTFVEVARLNKGLTEFVKQKADYSEILKLFAERTYDESGSYAIRPFSVEFKEHLRKDEYTLTSTAAFTNRPEIGDMVFKNLSSDSTHSRFSGLRFPSEIITGAQFHPSSVTGEAIGIIQDVDVNAGTIVINSLNAVSIATFTAGDIIIAKSADGGAFSQVMTLSTNSLFKLDTGGTYRLSGDSEIGDESKFIAKLSSGKVYVEGFAYESLLPVNVEFNKARELFTGNSSINGELKNIVHLKATDDLFTTTKNINISNEVFIKASGDIISVSYMGTPEDSSAQGTIQGWAPLKNQSTINLETDSQFLSINNKESVLFISGSTS